MDLIPRKLLLPGVAFACSTLSAWGQTAAPRPEVDLAFTYTAQRSNLTPGQFFWRQGGTLELSAEAHHGLGIAMNIAGSEASNILGTGISLHTLTTTFGPRYTLHHRKLAIFGQGLIGESHAWNSFFPEATGPLADFNTLALQVGGGLDLHVRRHMAVRFIQADWVRTEFPNATTNVQNDLRLGAGVVFRFPQ